MKAPPRLTLLCHGRTTARPSAFPADEPLADGERQKIAELVPRLGKPDQILTSPAQAARQTAEIVSQDFVIEAALADLDHGRWTGLGIAEIHASVPDGLAEWMENAEAALHGGESQADLLARISAWLTGGLETNGHTVAITHPHVLRAAVISVLGAPADALRRIDIEHLALVDLRSDGKRWTLRSLGRL